MELDDERDGQSYEVDISNLFNKCISHIYFRRAIYREFEVKRSVLVAFYVDDTHSYYRYSKFDLLDLLTDEFSSDFYIFLLLVFTLLFFSRY